MQSRVEAIVKRQPRLPYPIGRCAIWVEMWFPFRMKLPESSSRIRIDQIVADFFRGHFIIVAFRLLIDMAKRFILFQFVESCEVGAPIVWNRVSDNAPNKSQGQTFEVNARQDAVGAPNIAVQVLYKKIEQVFVH